MSCNGETKYMAVISAVMKKDSKNVNGNSRLQSPNFTLKLQGCAKVFRVKLDLCNLGFPYTFLESLFITDHCHVFSFLVTCWSLP